jgi:hypothetical protein
MRTDDEVEKVVELLRISDDPLMLHAADLLEAAGKDTERLNWLDVQPTEDVTGGDELKWSIGCGPFYEADDLRDAIDAAREGERDDR